MEKASINIPQHSLLFFVMFSVSYFSHIFGPQTISVPSFITIKTPGMSIWYVAKCMMTKCHTVYMKKERKPDVKVSRSKNMAPFTTG